MVDFSPIRDRLVTPNPVDHWLETSRCEMMRIVEDCRRDLAKRELAKSAMTPRRRAILQAVAKCMVLRHPRPLVSPLDLLAVWSGPGRFPSLSQMRGCMKAAKSMVSQLELDSEVAP